MAPGNTEDAEALASLMRAAHSIKGAARVIELNTVVGLAHAMEDVFVAAQEGRIVLDADHIDALLVGLDMFSGMAEHGESQLDDWFREQQEAFTSLEDAYKKIAAGKEVAAIPERPAKQKKIPANKTEAPKGIPDKAA